MSSMWKRTLSYLGLVEEYEGEYRDEPEQAPPPRRAEPPAPRAPAKDPNTNVRRIAPARGDRTATLAPAPPEPRGGATSAAAKGGTVHLTNPTTFNDVEEVGERFRNGIPVIMNLAGASESVAKRMLDFASGLIFGLDGRIERVGDRVFLLTPMGVEVSSEERRRLGERGFFNHA
jgi:cell division inhibitor SepF